MNNIYNTLLIVQIVTSSLLVVCVLLQNRAEGLGKMFGGGGEVFRTKRGLEKFLHYFTVTLVVILMVLSLTLLKLGE
ncbi:preprotein translocase subunit SecG [bacterium]|nr:preprotein translocase subunit SecG [bacterium]